MLRGCARARVTSVTQRPNDWLNDTRAQRKMAGSESTPTRRWPAIATQLLTGRRWHFWLTMRHKERT
eukprot:3304823-Alexandrium_andersonii.AAC.1